MPTEKLHCFKRTNIWIHRAHILHNNYLFAIRFMKAIPEPRDTGMPVLWEKTFDFALLTPLSPLTPLPLPWEAISSGILQVFWMLRHSAECQAQNGRMDKLLRRLYPLYSCKNTCSGKDKFTRSQLRQNTKHFYDPVHPYCTTPREPPQIIYSCLVGRTSKDFQL